MNDVVSGLELAEGRLESPSSERRGRPPAHGRVKDLLLANRDAIQVLALEAFGEPADQEGRLRLSGFGGKPAGGVGALQDGGPQLELPQDLLEPHGLRPVDGHNRHPESFGQPNLQLAHERRNLTLKGAGASRVEMEVRFAVPAFTRSQAEGGKIDHG